MSEDIKKEDVEEVVPSTTDKPEVKPEGEQDPLKDELEKVNKGGRTRKEKLLFTKKRVEQQLRELGEDIDPTPEVEDDEAPVTVGMLKQMQQQTATKNALQLAEEIDNETERELVKFHINNTIRSTGNPKEDFKLALAIVNSAKNSKIIEETIRKPEAKRATSSGGGAPEQKPEEDFTPDELQYLKPPFNLSKEQILAAREGKKTKFDK